MTYIENGQVEKAREELDEWLQMMPNDSDFMEMRNKI